MTNAVEKRYLNSSYLVHNPTWDSEDAPWKAGHIKRLLLQGHIKPGTICDIGCGSGSVLVELRKDFPEAKLHGYDISPDLEKFWDEHRKYGIDFHLGDYFSSNPQNFNVILVLDVLEHLANPFDFLESLKGMADHYIFHIPLDLSAMSVAREKPLLHVREKVGHIHYYTKSLALAMLSECGYRIDAWHYTDAYRTSPERNIKTKLAMLPRIILQKINKDMAVRLLGGETLMVVASVDTNR